MRVSHNVRKGDENQPNAGPPTIKGPVTEEMRELLAQPGHLTTLDLSPEYERLQRLVDSLTAQLAEASRMAVNLSAYLLNCERFRRPIQGNMQPVMVRMVPEAALMPMIEALRASFGGDAGEREVEGAPV